MSDPTETPTTRPEPCQRIVTAGYRIRHWIRCEMPEYHVVHDPLGPPGCHIYDPAPVCDEDMDSGTPDETGEVDRG